MKTQFVYFFDISSHVKDSKVSLLSKITNATKVKGSSKPFETFRACLEQCLGFVNHEKTNIASSTVKVDSNPLLSGVNPTEAEQDQIKWKAGELMKIYLSSNNIESPIISCTIMKQTVVDNYSSSIQVKTIQ